MNCCAKGICSNQLLRSAWIWQPLGHSKVSSTFLKGWIQGLTRRDEIPERNWWRFHQITNLNKLAVMALICPRLYFFMAHQCRTWCPSSIGKGRGFGFLPPRETTISIQQAPEVPGSTAHDVLCVSSYFFQSIVSLIYPESEGLHCSIQLLLLLEVWKKQNNTPKKKDLYATIVGNFVLFSFCASHFISHVALTFVSTRPIWGSRLSPDQFDVWINEETS